MATFVPHQVALFTQLLNDIIEQLYKADWRRLLKERTELINQQMLHNSVYCIGFNYRGMDYLADNMLPSPQQREYIRQPHEEVLPALVQHVKSVDLIKQEMTAMRQALLVMIRRCNDKQDIRDMLPDCAVKNVVELCILDRTRPVGFLYQSSPTLAERYDKVVQKMIMLSAIDLLY